jgi:tetratricopeptide (TPR) repeat protein
MKAMAGQPTLRYGSPRDLAQDVERWLADESITARRDGMATQLRRWIKRHPAVTASLTIAALFVFGVALINNWSRNREAEQLRRNAETDFAEADGFLSKRDAVEATRRINRVQGQLSRRPDLIDLVERARNLAARADNLVQAQQRTQQAQQRMQDFRLNLESMKPADLSDSDARAAAIEHLEHALNAFGMLDREDWQETEPFISLTEAQQASVTSAISSLYEEFWEVQRRNSHRGAATTQLGLQLHMPSDRLVRASRIAEVVPDSPAAKANLMPDDRIISVAGKAVTELGNSDDVIELLIGDPNTVVELQVIRGQPAKLETLSITRSPKGRVGIGQFLYETIQIAFVVPDSPAARAGVRSGDVLFGMDGQPPEGPIRRVGNIANTSPLAGLFGALVSAESMKRRLTLWRPSEQKLFEVEVPWDTHCRRAVERNHLGILYRFLRSEYGAYQSAIETRDKSLLESLDIDDPDAPLDEIIVRSKLKERWSEDLVRSVLRRLAEEFERNPEYPRATRLFNSQKYAEVIDVLLPYVAKHLTDPDAAALLIEALRRQHRPSVAISVCSQIITAQPQATRFYKWRADAFVEFQEFELAKRDLRRALELDPGNAKYQSLLEALELPIEKLKPRDTSK